MSYGSSEVFEKIRNEIQGDIANGYSYDPNYLYEIDNADRLGKISKQEAQMLYDLLGKLRKINEERDQEIVDTSRKEARIKIAKQRYNEKNAFWRFFHKKLNPSKMNLNNMSVEEIDDLTHTVMYGGKSGRTR